MTDQSIPSQLQGKLNELAANGNRLSLFIETGSDSAGIALARSRQIAQQLKSTAQQQRAPLASKPAVLLLLSQEHLEASIGTPGYDLRNTFTYLPESQSPRADLSSLGDPSRILATTPQRAIDHLRRDNIFLSDTRSVVIAYGFDQGPEESEEERQIRERAFFDDLRFIFTKLGPETIIECYIDELSHLARQPQELVEQHLVIALSEWERPAHPVEFMIAPATTAPRIVDTLYAMHESRYLIIHKDTDAWRTLENRLRKTFPPVPHVGVGFDRLTTLKEPDDSTSCTVVAIGLNSGETVTLIRYVGAWQHMIRRIVCIVTPKEAKEITTSKETLLMNTETKTTPGTEEVLAGKIQLLAEKVRVDANPEELDSFRKLFKKNVPFSLRGYVTAYLLREALVTSKPSGPKVRTGSNTAKTPRKPMPKTEAAPEKKQYPPVEIQQEQNEASIPEGARTLYLNIGKMRRLYAKELSQILQEQLGITHDDIYSIRVHDKYSFITLSQEHAEQAITKLNGMEIRGRTAVVSYSNKE